MYVTAHSSFCGSMNVKDLVTEDASHLNLNGSLCKQTCTHKPHNHCLFQYAFLVVVVIGRVNNMRDLCWHRRAEVV